MSDDAASALFYAVMIILPLSALIARRPPLGRTLKMAIAWAAIFVVGVVLANQRHHPPELTRKAAAVGGEVRIPQANDGHFYAEADLDGVRRRMLVDSGATTTALSTATARAIGLDLNESPFPAVIETANGGVEARTATVRRVRIGGIVADDVDVVVAAAFSDHDVLGMNFLSRLRSWRVKGRTLVLSPA